MIDKDKALQKAKMDRVVLLLRKLANDIGSFPKNNIITRWDYQLIADVDDLYNFIICVEELYDYHKGMIRPTAPHSDQLTLF